MYAIKEYREEFHVDFPVDCDLPHVDDVET
jgi:hypothetical protein